MYPKYRDEMILSGLIAAVLGVVGYFLLIKEESFAPESEVEEERKIRAAS